MTEKGTTSNDALTQLSPRPANAHKGDFGRVLIVGGSCGMTGAAALAGIAALRSGAGLVQVAVPKACWQVVAASEPSYMTVPLPGDSEGRLALDARPRIKQLSQQANVIACGPGLGQSDELVELVRWMNITIACPIVFDADALNSLAHHVPSLRNAAGPRILTPHPGEFGRLIGDPSAPIATLRDSVQSFAERHQAVVILKGHRSLITDGRRLAENETGNPGMATGGAGDVLTGIVAALVGQGLTCWEAARLGTHIHGRAGDLALDVLGETSLIASDLPRYLAAAFSTT